MKLIRCIPVLLLCGSLVAQVAPTNKPSSPQPEAAAATGQAKGPATIAPDAPVITLPGVCKSPSTSTPPCQTAVTRAEYEALANALFAGQPGSPTAELRQGLASQYGEMLVFAQEAERRGLDQGADFQTLLRFGRIQLLAQLLQRSIKEQARPSQEEIQKYYDENRASYEGIAVQRLMIPTAHPPKGKERDVQALAEEMRKRLVAGEDAAKLEPEIYSRLGFKNPPGSSLILRVSQLTPQMEPVAKLKAGEISAVLSDDSALSIYKCEGRKPVPLETVQEEIQAPLQQQKIKAAVDAVLGDRKPVLNNAYFGRVRAKNVHEE